MKTYKINRKICYLAFFIFCLAGSVWADITIEDLHGMIKNYESWGIDSDNRPLGDYNEKEIGNIDTRHRLTFSETVSYVLFQLVLQVPGENETESRIKFIRVWNWAKKNLIRKNIKEVYMMNSNDRRYGTWVKSKDLNDNCFNDNLMAWRYVPNIENKGRGGIIYMTEKRFDNEKWHDGSQVATDGDLLTAYTLCLAYLRGWGDEFLEDARAIVKDIRKKCVLDFKAGELMNVRKLIPSNIYWDSYDKENKTVLRPYPEKMIFEGNRFYVGFWHDPLLNLSDMQSLTVSLRGCKKFEVQLKDSNGFVYKTDPVILTDNFKAYSFKKSDFYLSDCNKQQPDWSKIKDIQFHIVSLEDRYIEIESINLVLKNGQTNTNDGFYLLSNAHAMLSVNVSYLMPFAFRMFMSVDPDEKNVWQALLDDSYKVLEKSLKVELYNSEGRKIRGNGQLFPNFFQLNLLSGNMTDTAYQKEFDYKFGWDAFRTIYYLAFDYAIYNDPRDLKLLKTVAPFFEKEIRKQGDVYAEYEINGGITKDKAPYPAPSGMNAVYLCLFQLLGNKPIEDKFRNLLLDKKRTKGERVWFFSESAVDKYGNKIDPTDGEKDYYKNMWAFFGSYLYLSNDTGYSEIKNTLKRMLSKPMPQIWTIYRAEDNFHYKSKRCETDLFNFKADKESFDLYLGGGYYDTSNDITGWYWWTKLRIRPLEFNLFDESTKLGLGLFGSYAHGSSDIDDSDDEWDRYIGGITAKLSGAHWDFDIDLGAGVIQSETVNGLYRSEQDDEIVYVSASFEDRSRREKYKSFLPKLGMDVEAIFPYHTTNNRIWDDVSLQPDSYDKRRIEGTLSIDIYDFSIYEGQECKKWYLTPGLKFGGGREYGDDANFFHTGPYIAFSYDKKTVGYIAGLYKRRFKPEEDDSQWQGTFFIDFSQFWK